VRVWYPAVAPNTESIQDDVFASIPDPTPQFDAPPATGSGPFPHIVFGHGLGATPAQYGDLLAAWAGAGFVVAAPAFPLTNQDSPGVADAGDVANQSDDISAVITQAISLSSSADGRALAGMVDGERVGVAGHSNGGFFVNKMACDYSHRIAAIVSLAGALEFD
jgi:predicted dienelactone hydrolase